MTVAEAKAVIAAARAAKRERANQIKSRLAEGWKPAAIAHEWGVTTGAVRYYKGKRPYVAERLGEVQE